MPWRALLLCGAGLMVLLASACSDDGGDDFPRCPVGLQCSDHPSGIMACLQEGDAPASAPTDCMESDCAGNATCVFTDATETASACVENCGSCESGTKCSDVTGGGYLGCLTEEGVVPADAPTNCHVGAGCPGNMTCFFVNAELTQSVCIANCSACSAGSCGAGEICGPNGACIPEPCTVDSCAEGEICYKGSCIPDIGEGPGPGPGPNCELPQLQCTDAPEVCGELVQFSPSNNPADAGYDPLLGYVDYPENGESWDDQFRSFLRRDLSMAIQYAAAKTACKAKDWLMGNGGPVGLVDMSEADGSIPGTSIGYPGHPAKTHTDGFDIDVAYFQVDTDDNRARSICEHLEDGVEAYHCTAAPNILDPWRTALFIGTLYEHPRLRLVGVDGKVGPMIEACMETLCADGWLTGPICGADPPPFLYEVVDKGMGFFKHHHHHFHVSLKKPDA